MVKTKKGYQRLLESKQNRMIELERIVKRLNRHRAVLDAQLKQMNKLPFIQTEELNFKNEKELNKQIRSRVNAAKSKNRELDDLLKQKTKRIDSAFRRMQQEANEIKQRIREFD